MKTMHQSRTDAVRDAHLRSLGWTILRFWNDHILRDIDGVCRHVINAAGLIAPNEPMPTPFLEEHL
jgi:very-short-patch-repair endonuclease